MPPRPVTGIALLFFTFTVVLAFHHDLFFTPLGYTYITFTSSPQFTSLYLTSLYFIDKRDGRTDRQTDRQI
jgi:hypothetical protein